MKVAIVFDSKTGNTKRIAEAISEGVKDEDVIYFGGIKEDIDADIFFVGSWTDKGMCSVGASEFLATLKGKHIAYFGTCGFGGDSSYYDRIYSRVLDIVDESNVVISTPFICQGKMPIKVRDRYVDMLHENPDDARLKVSIMNFDEALNHPNSEDLDNAKCWARDVISKVKQGK